VAGCVMDGWGSVLGSGKNCLTLIESRDLSCRGVNPRFEPETYRNRSGCAAHLTAARDYQLTEASDGRLSICRLFKRRIFISVGAVAASALRGDTRGFRADLWRASGCGCIVGGLEGDSP
jgi:hypothetical protein